MSAHERIAPFFVGGAEHGKPLPPELLGHGLPDFVQVFNPKAHSALPESEQSTAPVKGTVETYFPLRYWRPDGRSFTCFALNGMLLDEAVELAWRILLDGRTRKGA